MSYHPSHRKPPRQERWPDATPDQAWPAYVGADSYRDAQAWGATGTLTGNGYDARGEYGGGGEYRGGSDYSSGSDYRGGWDGRAGTWNGYGAPAGSYPAAYDDYRGTGGYPGAAEGPGGPSDAFDGGDGFDGRASSYSAGGYGTLAEEYAYGGSGTRGHRDAYGTQIAYGTRQEYAEAWDNGRAPAGTPIRMAMRIQTAGPNQTAGPKGMATPILMIMRRPFRVSGRRLPVRC